MTTNDLLPARPAPEPFMVVASLHEARLQITARSVLAATAAAEYWRGLGATEVDWFLREDLTHPRPVLLFTRQDGSRVVHATELVVGKPVLSHTTTCCGVPLRWEVMQVRTADLAKPCPACLTAIRSAGLFSAPDSQRRIASCALRGRSTAQQVEVEHPHVQHRALLQGSP